MRVVYGIKTWRPHSNSSKRRSAVPTLSKIIQIPAFNITGTIVCGFGAVEHVCQQPPPVAPFVSLHKWTRMIKIIQWFFSLPNNVRPTGWNSVIGISLCSHQDSNLILYYVTAQAMCYTLVCISTCCLVYGHSTQAAEMHDLKLNISVL